MTGQAKLFFLLIFCCHYTRQLQICDPNQEDDLCIIQTAAVMKGLKNCEEASFKTNEQIAEVGRETIKALWKQQNDEIKSQFDQMTRKLERMKSDLLAASFAQVQDNANAIKSLRCQSMLKWGDLFQKHLISVNGRHFYFTVDEMDSQSSSWYKGREWCLERGMKLASLSTLNQLEAVAKEMNEHDSGYDYWVSASDIGHTAGEFHWLDGLQLDESLWHEGHPKHKHEGNDTCVYLHTKFAKLLSSSTCSYDRFVLCEVPSPLSSCLL